MLTDYKNFKGDKISTQIDLGVEILTSGHWPFQETAECKVPAQL